MNQTSKYDYLNDDKKTDSIISNTQSVSSTMTSQFLYIHMMRDINSSLNLLDKF